MARCTPKRLRARVLVPMIGLALSMLLRAPVALAQEDPFALDLTMTETTLDKSGFVTVTVTVACTDPSQIFGGCASVTQPVGRTNYVTGFACVRETGQCDPMAPYIFRVEIFPSGRFVPGNAVIRASTSGCALDASGCADEEITVSKRLRH